MPDHPPPFRQTTLPPSETPTETTAVPEEYEDFFVGSPSSSSSSSPPAAPSPTERIDIDEGSVVYEDEYGNPIYVDENGQVFYPSAEGSGQGSGAAYDDYGYYGEYGQPAETTLGPLEAVDNKREEVFYGTESGPRRDEQGCHSIALIMSTLHVFMFPYFHMTVS